MTFFTKFKLFLLTRPTSISKDLGGYGCTYFEKLTSIFIDSKREPIGSKGNKVVCNQLRISRKRGYSELGITHSVTQTPYHTEK